MYSPSLYQRCWQEFYETIFNVAPEKIPELPAAPDAELVLPLISLKDVTLKAIAKKVMGMSGERVKLESPTDGWFLPQRQRPIGNYIVFVRDHVSPDLKFENQSLNWVKRQKISAMTLKERLLFELFQRFMNKPPLDNGTWTLCNETPNSEGRIPAVGRQNGILEIQYVGLDFYSHIHRVREVILRTGKQPSPK